ncbi:MAG: lamin tail domain-containing protein [Candidatus Gracilibacteria bacterium]|jgi:hypothetical protein
MRKLLISLMCMSLVAPLTAHAAQICVDSAEISTAVEISAIYPNPNTGEDEWIEIKNTSTKVVLLDFYTLEDATAKPWALTGSLAANGTSRLSGFPFALNNSDETVTLKTTDGVTVDTFAYKTTTKGQIITKEDIETTATTTTTETPNTSTTPPAETTTTTSTQTPATTPTLWPSFSEALPNPVGSDSSEEWIELYNPHDQILTLDGLNLDDEEGGSTPYKLTGTLAPESYLLITIVDSKITLNNDTDHVRLLGINNEILWDITYSDTKEGESWVKIGDSYTFTTPTPGEENTAPQAAPQEETANSTGEDSPGDTVDPANNGDLSENVDISEVFPNPEGPDQKEEWIELTNGGTVPVDLGNWILDDGPGGSDPYVIPSGTIVAPGGTLVLYRTESGVVLNNTSETVELSDYTGEIMSEVSYDESVEGESYSEITVEDTASEQASLNGLGNQIFSIWKWTIPTPGETNPIWKQIKGEVADFDGQLLTLFDGISNWTFKTASAQTDNLLYSVGNTILVQAAMKNGIYEIMSGELVSANASQNKSGGSGTPWSLILSSLALTTWISYEVYKRRKERAKKNLHFDEQALN